jgi:hypothetical protein
MQGTSISKNVGKSRIESSIKDKERLSAAGIQASGEAQAIAGTLATAEQQEITAPVGTPKTVPAKAGIASNNGDAS